MFVTGPTPSGTATPVLDGGGLFLASRSRCTGHRPGGGSVLRDHGQDRVAHHRCDADGNGTPKPGPNEPGGTRAGRPTFEQNR